METNSYYKTYLIFPKLLYFFFGLKTYAIYQYRGIFITKGFKYSDSDYGFYYGLIMFLAFFNNMFNQFIFENCNPKIFIISNLLFSSCCLQLIFHVPKIFFWPLFYLYTVSVLLFTPLVERIVLQYFEKNEIATTNYGSQKIFETFSYLVVGFICEPFFRINDNPELTKLVWFEHIITFIAICITFLINYEHVHSENTDFLSMFKLNDWQFWAFIYVIFMYGIVRTGLTAFVTNYHKTILKIEELETNLRIFSFFKKKPLFIITFFSLLFEFICLKFSKNIIDLIGLFWPIVFAGVIQIVRVLFYTFLNQNNRNNVIFVSFIECLKGMNFALIQPSGVQIVNKLVDSPKTLALVVYSSAYNGVSYFVSGVFLGKIIGNKENIEDYRKFFIVCSLIILIGMIVFWFTFQRDLLKWNKRL
ncbi:hypothetical protein CDIK_0357 [Cucumispora dikerogammari]|nr:hypothetical protein CDIK_0357 [Cucumispora dikerogammari]